MLWNGTYRQLNTFLYIEVKIFLMSAKTKFLPLFRYCTCLYKFQTIEHLGLGFN